MKTREEMAMAVKLAKDRKRVANIEGVGWIEDVY